MLQRATLKQLRIFESAARYLHFGRAAAELHLTPPAVSIQLKQLEQAIGLALFEQIGRRMHLTPVGAELLGHARALLARLREADDALEGLKGGAGELHVAATTTAEYFAPRLLAEFRKQRRGVKLRLTVDNREAVVRELGENSIDLAIMGRAPRGLDTTAVAFARHPFAIIAAPDHPLARKRRVGIVELAGEPFLIGPNEAIKQAVAAGMGVGFVSRHTVGLELATGRLAVLAVTGTPVMRDWYAVHRARKRLSPPAIAFKSYLVTQGAAVIDKAMH
jgi:DNA-binding transcriptional LysR family regulator